MRHRFLLIGVIIAIFLIGCTDTNDDTNEKEEMSTPVEVEKIKTGDFTVDKTLYGQTAPIKQVPVVLEQPGEITILNVKNGDTVSKDDHLATIQTPAGDTEINAPADGTIAQLQTTEGNTPSNEEPLLVVVDIDKLLIHYAVTAQARDLFKVDKEMDIHIEDETYEATVTSIDTVPNETGQYAIDLEFDNQDGDVLPGIPAKLLLTDKTVKDTNIVPTEAILTENEEQFIFIVQDDHVEKVIVDVLETQSEESAIDADVQEDDQVVVNGHFTLTDEDVVDIQKEGK